MARRARKSRRCDRRGLPDVPEPAPVRLPRRKASRSEHVFLFASVDCSSGEPAAAALSVPPATTGTGIAQLFGRCGQQERGHLWFQDTGAHLVSRL